MNKIKTPPYPNFPIVSNNKITLRQIHNPDVIDLIEISYYDAVQAKTLEQAIKMNLKIKFDDWRCANDTF